MSHNLKKNIFLLISIVLIDLGSKFLFFKFAPQLIHFNHGFFLGNMSHSSQILRVVALGSSAAFILFIYLVQLYIMPGHFKRLRFAITFLVGGILGNVIDRIHDAKTIDFIPFKLFHFNAAFNPADIFLVFGALLILYLIFFKDTEIWHPENTRKRFIIMPNHQYRIASYFALSALFFCLILGVFCYSFLQTQIPSYILKAHDTEKMFYLLLASQGFLYILASFYFGLLITHKTYGPLYAFISYIKSRTDDSLKTRGDKLRLRSGDYFKELEELADKIDHAIDQ